MRNVAYIPVRGGSKSIPHKNIKLIAGKPLVYWTVKAACDCADIDHVYVCTDSETIRETVQSFCLDKVSVIGRSPESATDTASTEAAMLEFSEQYEFENIVLIQATSPLLTSSDLHRGFEALEHSDSVISTARQYRFLWRETVEGFVEPINYDYLKRPRRQDFDGFLVENGAFYITGKNELIKTQCRVSGKIKAVEMPSVTYTEIDESDDWLIVESLLKRRVSLTGIPKVKMFLTDCDGTMTDGGMYYSKNGEELKKFNTADGVGLRLLKEQGLITGIITGENSEIVRKRADKLNIDEVHLGVANKIAVVGLLCKKYSIDISEIAFIGDDLNDLEVIKSVGYGICPSNAVEIVKDSSCYVTHKKGGEGAVREAADWLLRESVI